MLFCNNIKVGIILLTTLNFFKCLSAMDYDSGAQTSASARLEENIFGQRIRVENQTGYRLLLKIHCKAYQWKTVLENDSSVDVGSLKNVPEKIEYEPYGKISGRIYAFCGASINLDCIGVVSDVSVTFRIKQAGMFGIRKNIEKLGNVYGKSLSLQNLFPSLKYHLIEYKLLSGMQDEPLNGTNLSRYILGLSENFDVCDINVKAIRLLEEYNPDLYEERDRDLMVKVSGYVEWARTFLLTLPNSTNKEQFGDIRKELIGLMLQIIGEQKKI